MHRSNLKQSGWRLAAGGASVLLGTWVIVTSCAEHREWTPFAHPGEPMKTVGEQEISMRSSEYQDVRKQENAGCISCHEGVGDPHPTTEIGCVDCHGGNGITEDKEEAHPEPQHPDRWPAGGANPEHSYALLNDESRDWIQFVNPGDLRVANETCGPCHPDAFLHVSKSLMTNAAHFYGVVSYANGILPTKHSILGESYSPEGIAQMAFTVPAPSAEDKRDKSVLPYIVPLPNFEVGQTANVLRVFEKGSRLGGAGLGFNGNPVPLVGIPDKFEDPGRPNNRLSDRGLGTLNRVDLPLLNVFKTRLNDPFLSFLGTNDQPGDYRSSGCTACHVVYANDGSPVSSGPYAKYGNRGHGNVDQDPWGEAVKPDPTIAANEPGHPLEHKFTTAIPSSQCMVCHMHQPNSFVNSYFGFTMWTYETDGALMWPAQEKKPTIEEMYEVMLRNPEGAAQRGKWGDVDFLADSADLNPSLEHTQFADYHGHGWMFRGAFKMDRKGNLLDGDGNAIDYSDPTKLEGVLPPLDQNVEPPFTAPKGKAVHLMDIHAEKGMHCVDCHFEQDVHGDGKLYAEYQAAIEITCQDCHGTFDAETTLVTSGPAAPPGGTELGGRSGGRTPFGEDRFEQRGDEGIFQRSMLYPDKEWPVPQVAFAVADKDVAAHKTESSHGGAAHGLERMECYTCHTAWVTSCFGCHLPQQANWKTQVSHYDDEELRNYATYNPQVVRDSEFMLGVAGTVKGKKIAPVRSSSAVLISSEDALRQKIYGGVPTIAANGMSSQAFNTHFPHTVRTKETRACDDCHLSKDGDNNAWLAQTYLLGTGAVNFMGHNLFVGEEGEGFEAVRVTEWDEPQAVVGSNLQRLAYPERYAQHLALERQLQDAEYHHGKGKGKTIRSLQLRGEYLFTASGRGGFRAYDVANVNNKGFSEKMVSAPFSPLGQDTHVSTRFATAVALPTNNHITMSRDWRPDNQERPYEYRGTTQNMHESYRYAYISDREEGLILVDVDTLHDWDPQNNFLKRALTFNPGGKLSGAENLTVAGTTVYVCCDAGVVAVDIDDPLEPQVIATVSAPDVVQPTSIQVQFRYAFVTDANGLTVLDVTTPAAMRAVPGARVPIPEAWDVYVAKTYAYVSAGSRGLVIVDVEKPEAPDQVGRPFDADGRIKDLRQTKVAMTNDSLFAYLADAETGVLVLQLVTPEDGGRSAYGFSPVPQPELIATYATHGPALALSRGLDRDRAVDESGNQMAVFGRIGGGPMDLATRERLYRYADGQPYVVSGETHEPLPNTVSAGHNTPAGGEGTAVTAGAPAGSR